jgi:hypothetical protein
MAQTKRRRLWIDPEVQGSLVSRAVLYWAACVATIELLNLSWLIATGPEQPSFTAYFLNQDWRPALVRIGAAGVLLVPIVLDMLQLSNRFAGPVFRMKRVLRSIAAGGKVETITLRDNDYWHGFAAELNAALATLGRSQSPPPHEHDAELLEHAAGG